MKVSHFLSQQTQIQKQIADEVSFLLSNKLGGYLWLSEFSESRYQGWFFSFKTEKGARKMVKVLDSIILEKDEGSVNFLQNNYYSVDRKRSALRESFFMPSSLNALVYETSRPLAAEIVLDIKDSYSVSESGRYYQIVKNKGNLIVIKYFQEGSDLPPLFLAIRRNKGETETIEKWDLKNYSFDRDRNSVPFSRFVFRALNFKGVKKAVFAISRTEKGAIKKARYVYKNTLRLKTIQLQEIENALLAKTQSKKLSEKEISMAFLASKKALSDLVVYSIFENMALGIYGGLPWFFQFWPRDEAICLKALSLINPKAASSILSNRIDSITRFNKIIQQDMAQNEADALGWVLKRFSDFSKSKVITPELVLKKKDLDYLISVLLEKETENGLAVHHPKETWMDTLERSNACIEIQALRLNIYKLASQMSGLGEKKTFYLKLERDLKKKVKELFWDGNFLADGFNLTEGTSDFTARPNVFLACYIYPDLLTNKEWTKCFENILPRLFLPWGGLATLDKNNPNFRATHTGEIPLSYHKGDSWFYLNNLAALVMHRVDKNKFAPYVEKIIAASCEDILYKGIVGYHSELSSSDAQKAQGCLAQAWSSAMFIEAVKEIYQL